MPLLTFGIFFKTFVPQVPLPSAGAWRSPPVTLSCTGTRAPPSGVLTVLHEFLSRLGALKPSLFPVVWLWFSLQGLLRWYSPTCVNLWLD